MARRHIAKQSFKNIDRFWDLNVDMENIFFLLKWSTAYWGAAISAIIPIAMIEEMVSDHGGNVPA